MSKKINDKIRLSKRDKIFYNLVFSASFAVVLILILCYNSVLLLINSFKDRLCIIPSSLSMIMYFISLILATANILYIYNRTYLSKISINKLITGGNLIKKCVAFSTIVFLVFAFAIVCNITNVTYVNSNGEYISDDTSFGTHDIDSAEVYVEKSLVSMPRTATFKEYTLVCKITTNKKQFLLNSSFFHSYEDFYNYLLLIDKSKITVTHTGFDELTEYENNRFFSKQSEIDILNLIYQL